MKHFVIPTVRFDEFLNEVKETAKKFKVTGKVVKFPEMTETEVFDHYHEKMVKIPAWDVDVVIEDKELEKFVETGFAYLGAIRKDVAVTVSQSKYAMEHDIDITKMVAEIKNMPCDACKKSGSNRKTVHVFLKDGKVTSYGTTCAVAKFGINFERILSRFESIWNRFNEWCGEGNFRLEEYDSIRSWIACCYVGMIDNGYVSSNKAYNEGGESTAQFTNHMYRILHEGYMTCEYDHELFARYNEDYKECMETFDYEAFAKYDHVGEKTGDFAHNIKTMVSLLEGDLMSPKLYGYLAWMVFDFWNSTIRFKPEKVEWNETHSYKVGDKFKNVTVEMMSVHTFEGYYGVTAIYTMKDSDGVKLKWFTSPKYEVGDTVKLTSGNVKELEDHPKFGKSVIVTRCRGKVI